MPLLAGFVRYAALTLVITIGVAAGILLTRGVDNVGGPSPAPTPTPSLRFVGVVADDARLLAADTARAWLVTRSEQLIPIANDGTAGEPIEIGFAPSDLDAIRDSAEDYGGPETVWLIAPNADLLRVDPTVGEVFRATGVRGTQISLGSGAAWVSRAGEITKVLPDLVTLTTSPFAAHRAADPFLVTSGSLWVADASGIERLDPATGRRGDRISGGVAALLEADGLVWAARGARLVAFDPASGEIRHTMPLPNGASNVVAMATHGNTIWLATSTGSQGPLLIGLDAATSQTISLTPLSTPSTSIAVVGNQVWTLDAAGHVGRYEPG
jgi:hypothetical protein